MLSAVFPFYNFMLSGICLCVENVLASEYHRLKLTFSEAGDTRSSGASVLWGEI